MTTIENENSLRPFTNQTFPFEVTSKISIVNEFLIVEYSVAKNIDSIILPAIKTNPGRTIGLWNRTCFELFLRPKNLKEYIEFNFSPSHDWNCFKFNDLNDELREWIQVKKIDLKTFTDQNLFHLKAQITLKNLPLSFLNHHQLQFSTTAVIEENNLENPKSYWAIKHTDNKPNFHHPESFTSLI